MPIVWQLLEYVHTGGWIMIPLGAVSIAMWLLIAERLIWFRSVSRNDIPVRKAVWAVERVEQAVYGSGMRATLLKAFLSQRTGDSELDRDILRQCAMRMRAQFTRFLAAIAVLAGVAPLLGLLGTVIGMIETFDVIALFGTGNARALAGGISVALITTQSGLLVAIPGLFASAALSKRASAMVRSLDEITLLLLQHV